MTLLDDVTKLARSIDPGALSASRKPRTRRSHLKLLFLGTGVIGGSVGGWIASKYENVFFMDQGETARALKKNGITLYHGDHPGDRERVRVKVIDDLEEARDADVVVLGVKNFSLEAVAARVKETLGDRPIIVGMQNGLANQRILPAHFSRVIYCIVSYNAWMDESGVIGFQKKGPLHLGTLRNELGAETSQVAEVFNLGVETHVTDRIADAAYCKLVINLVNSVTTLVGLKYREISDRSLFQKLMTGVTYEGIQVVKAAGCRESKLGGMPSWALLRAGAKLPQALTRGMFERNVKKMVLSSMAQDIIQRGGKDSELESINGALLDLAGRHGVPAPLNRAVYDLCRQEFAKPKFEPLDVKEVWDFVQARLPRG